MKKILLCSVLLTYGTALIGETAAHSELKHFVHVSRRCLASARATDNEEAFNAFKKINDFYIEHRREFKNIELLSSQESQTLSHECSQLLLETLFTTTKAPASRTALPLSDAIKVFTRAMPHLLSNRSTSALFGRLTLLSMVELIFFGLERSIAPPKKRKKMPLFNERVAAFKDIPFYESYFTKMIGLGIGKTLAIGAVNEYTQQGISPYLHKLAETIIPKVVAIIAQGILELNGKKKLSADFWRGAGLKIGSPLILGKAFVHQSHPLYKPLLILSYIFPFFSGNSGEVFLAPGIFNANTWKNLDLNTLYNILFDGAAGGIIFNAIPNGVESLLPKKNMTLNPDHRRKTIRNAVRSIFDTIFASWNKKAF